MSILPFSSERPRSVAPVQRNSSMAARRRSVEEKRFARIRAAIAVEEDPLDALLEDAELARLFRSPRDEDFERACRQVYDWLREIDPGEYEGPPTPIVPSGAPPGSAEKLAVMEARYPAFAAVHPLEYELAFLLPEEVEVRVRKIANGVRSLGAARRKGAA